MGGLGAGISAGILKEAVWDKRMHRGTCNNMSAVSTFMGSAVSTLINLIVYDLQHKKSHYAKWLFNQTDKISKEDIKEIMK